MTLEEAGHIVLSGEKAWKECPKCKGFGRCKVYNGDVVMKDSMGNDTDLVSTNHFRCHQCRGRAWVSNEDVKKALKKLGLSIPKKPSAKKADTSGFRKARTLTKKERKWMPPQGDLRKTR